MQMTKKKGPPAKVPPVTHTAGTAPATPKSSKGKSGKESIAPPKAPLLTEEAKKLPTGDHAAGRVLAEEAIAVKQGVKPKKKP
jgi:hypothetical protein